MLQDHVAPWGLLLRVGGTRSLAWVAVEVSACFLFLSGVQTTPGFFPAGPGLLCGGMPVGALCFLSVTPCSPREGCLPAAAGRMPAPTSTVITQPTSEPPDGRPCSSARGPWPTLGFRRLSAVWLKLFCQDFVSSAAEIRLVSVPSQQNALGSVDLVLTRSCSCFWGGPTSVFVCWSTEDSLLNRCRSTIKVRTSTESHHHRCSVRRAVSCFHLRLTF